MMSIIYSAEPHPLTNWKVLCSMHWLPSINYLQRLTFKGGFTDLEQSPSPYAQLFATVTAKSTNELIFSLTYTNAEDFLYESKLSITDHAKTANNEHPTPDKRPDEPHQRLHKQLCLNFTITRTLYMTTLLQGSNHLLILFFNVKDMYFFILACFRWVEIRAESVYEWLHILLSYIGCVL